MKDWYTVSTQTKWGDYWRILIAGMTAHLPRRGDRLQLERTGPFVPPMVTSGMDDLIIVERMKATMQLCQGVIGFRPVHKSRIVRLDWVLWQLDGDCPELLRFQEPEDVVLQGEHDHQLADEIGEIYEVLLDSDGIIECDFDDGGNPLNTFLDLPTRRLDLFSARTVGGFAVPIGTEQFVRGLSDECKRWLEFNPVS